VIYKSARGFLAIGDAYERLAMKRRDQISGLIILLVAVFYLFKTTKLAIWKGTTLGPGFFPLLLGIALVALTILLLVKATLATKAHSLSLSERFFPSRSGLLRLLYLIGALVLYVSTLQPLGYLLSTLLFLCVLFWAWDPKRPGLAIAVAVGTVLCSYVFFDLLLKVQLPKGLLG
jgi:putative tricarboxylic transport membrane protein